MVVKQRKDVVEMKYNCPKCGKSLDYSVDQLTQAQYHVTCPQCGSALEIVGDYAYMPLEDGSLNLADDTPPATDEPQPGLDPLYQHAVDYIITCNAITPTMLASYFDIPIERAHILMQQLEDNGVVAPAQGGAPRTILIPHNTNLPLMFGAKFDPNAPTTPPEFNKDNIHGRSCTINCSGCLFILLLIALVATFFLK